MRPRILVLLAVIFFAAGCSRSGPVQPETVSGQGSTAIVIPEPGDVGGRPLTATLMTENEVPTCTEPPPPARGTATVSINPGQSQVCWVIDVADAAAPFTGAHIHEAPVGSAGSIVVPFTPPNASGHSEGCRTADRELLKEIMQNPEEYYVNVHNMTCPAGVARGQLSK
jgi:CHRD domain